MLHVLPLFLYLKARGLFFIVTSCDGLFFTVTLLPLLLYLKDRHTKCTPAPYLKDTHTY